MEQLNSRKSRVVSILKQETREILFLELHGRVDGIPQLTNSMVKEWRSLSLQHGVPFFAFTLLREPLSFYLSYFQHFHHPGCQASWCEPKVWRMTNEANFLQALQSNQQCRELFSGQRWHRKREEQPPEASWSDCQDVRDELEATWDWVGITSRLQNSTLPLLTHLLFHNHTMGRGMHRKNHHTRKYLDGLSRSTERAARRQCQLDQWLYEYASSREAAALQTLRAAGLLLLD